ncbi:hypothetical protein V495_03650 [Pseudogymnoascus sp. VKM F-4514 (FW-929)]|nr:hypothetical protein V490_03348 [Pseudogymnoascus sp. VKM F-3557]KFY44052.1 hypothetical protein V495_03650 [Pseudogymnoascus sp. VKM F-4514 (FW-929)]KFY56419.1 hypothetical protein V497_06284 [Pseudogymnoascus sp. VKM F-4516 (FW-969)]
MAATETNGGKEGGVMDVVLEFTGGLESLTSSKRVHKVSIPATLEGRPTDVASLVRRPGILVLINDADWELEGGEAYVLQPGDNILFVSTLHGG